MALENLAPAKGSVKKIKRIGRGQGSGMGKTSTRGGKGQTARTGSKQKEVLRVGNSLCKDDFQKLVLQVVQLNLM